MSAPTREQMTTLRWLAYIYLIALFVTDYGLDAWARPVPNAAYGIGIGIALGIDVKTMRDLFIQFLRNLVRANDQKPN